MEKSTFVCERCRHNADFVVHFKRVFFLIKLRDKMLCWNCLHTARWVKKNVQSFERIQGNEYFNKIYY